MNIEKLKEEKRTAEELAKKNMIDTATLEYKKQKDSIQSIMKEQGYKTIKKFWEMQLEQAETDLKNVRFSDLQEFGRVQSKANISDKFLSFLNNLEG